MFMVFDYQKQWYLSCSVFMEFKKQLTDWIGYIYILVIFGFIVICNKYIYIYIYI